MKIRTKLYASAILYTGLISILALLLLFFSFRVRKELDKSELVDGFAKGIAELSILTDEFIAYKEKRMEQQWQWKYTTLSEILEKAEELIELNIIRLTFESLNKSFSFLKINYRERQELLRKNAPKEEIDRTIILEERVAARMRMETQKLITLAFGVAENSRQRVNAIQQKANLILLFFTISMILFIAAITVRIIGTITKSIDELIMGAERIGRGQLDYHIRVTAKDETAVLANAFNEMTKKMIGMIETKREYTLKLEKEIVERKQIQEALSQSEASLTEAQRIAHLGNWDWDIVQNDLYWSDEIYQIFGLKPQEFGVTYEAFLNSMHPDDRESVKKAFDEALYENKPFSIDHRIILPDGRERIVHKQAEVTFDDAGKAIRMVGTLQDITERKQAEEALRKAHDELETTVVERTKELSQANIRLKELDRLKSMFIASMSHELRTPLNSIIGFTGIILQGISGEITEDQRKELTMVKNSAHHLLVLINDVIDVSKIEAGKVELFIEEFNLADVIQEVNDSFKVAVDEKGLKLSLQTPEELIIKSDERRAKQVIMNFVSNAVKFTDRGKIEIKVVKKDGRVEVSVADTGIGIKKENIEKLFRQFSRIYVKGRLVAEGTGLGLYLSKKIANLLGGQLKAESEFGKGSVFTFTLPLKYMEEKNEKDSGSGGQ